MGALTVSVFFLLAACRSFTPVLTEMYELLKESYPTHGLEIVFVSSDRDAGEFNQYFASMPWLAVPFESIGLYKQLLSATYNIRGIPSLIILDSVSGQIVVSLDEARQQVMQTCRRGDEAIRSMFETHWLDRVPLESKQLLEMLQRSCAGDVGRNEETPNVSPLQTSYLIRKESREKEARFQALVAQLLDEGMELEEATEAATAVEEVTFEEKRVDEDLEAGPLNGLFWRTLLADSMKMTSSEWATRVLKESGREQLGTVLSTARKYLTNCIKSHCNPKFRNFQLSFKAADAMTRVPGGLQLLQSLGFEIYGNAEDFVACIPVYADLDAMYAELSSLHTQYTSS